MGLINCMNMADEEVQPSPLFRELIEMKEAYGDPPSHDADGEPVPSFSLPFSFGRSMPPLLKLAPLKDPVQKLPRSLRMKTCCPISMSQLPCSLIMKTCRQISVSQYQDEESIYLASNHAGIPSSEQRKFCVVQRPLS